MTDHDSAQASDENASEVDDLEAAYQQALNAIDAAEDAVHDALLDTANGMSQLGAMPTEPEAAVSIGADLDAPPTAAVDLQPEESDDAEPSVSPTQIVEAALFVGGEPLATKQLRSLFRGEVKNDDIVDLVDRLNQRYATENRPYEVRLGEGGYTLELRDEFQSLRRKLFGLGPREVKLTQDVLEVLSLVAYHQPISKQEIEALGRDKPGSMLRHLLLRELIAIERDEESRETRYRTTDRFLELVGVSDLDDLPRAEAISFK